MIRMEMTLWTLIMFTLAWSTTAKADHFYSGPPVREAYALSIELSREAAALSYDAERLLCNCNDYDDVLEELCDVARELDDLNRALRKASLNPRKWGRICKRADDVAEEVCELDKEIHKAVEDLNRYRPRQSAFVPRGPSQYRSLTRTAPDSSVTLRIGSSGVRLVKYANNGIPRKARATSPYRGVSQGYFQMPVGGELISRVHRMQAIAAEIHRLARTN